MSKDGFYGSGGASGATPTGGGTCGGVGSIWDKLNVLEFNQNKILTRIEWLESAQDEKSEPESLPIGHDLSKEQISDKLLFNKQREIEELKTKIADKHKLLEDVMNQRDRYKNQMNAKQKVLEDVIDQRDRYLKQIYELSKQLEDVKKDNEYSSGTLKNYEDRVAELDQENKDLKGSINHQKTTITYLQNLNLDRVAKITELEKQFKELEKTNYHQHGIITDYKNEIKQWESKKSALENDKMYWEEQVKKLQMENGDLRWRFDNPALVEQQAARECVEIINKIKNEPLTTVSTHREWMVAICEDIEAAIKKEFNLNG